MKQYRVEQLDALSLEFITNKKPEKYFSGFLT